MHQNIKALKFQLANATSKTSLKKSIVTSLGWWQICMFYCKIFKFTRTSDLARRSARRMKMKITKILQTPLIPKAVRELLTGYHATRRPAAGEQIGRWQNSAQSIVSILCRVITHVNQRLYKTQTEKLTVAARVDHSARVMPEKSKWFRPSHHESYPPSQTPLKTPRLSREFETPEKGKYREE